MGSASSLPNPENAPPPLTIFRSLNYPPRSHCDTNPQGGGAVVHSLNIEAWGWAEGFREAPGIDVLCWRNEAGIEMPQGGARPEQTCNSRRNSVELPILIPNRWWALRPRVHDAKAKCPKTNSCHTRIWPRLARVLCALLVCANSVRPSGRASECKPSQEAVEAYGKVGQRTKSEAWSLKCTSHF